MASPQQGATREHPEGTKVLILGVVGVAFCQILGPFAWRIGNRVLSEIDAAPSSYSNRGNVNAGRICGIVATVLLVLSIVAYVAIFAVVLASDDSSTVGALG